MATRGTFQINTLTLDDINRALRLIQGQIVAQDRSAANVANAVQLAPAVVSRGGGSGGGRSKYIYLVTTDTGGNILIDTVGRAYLSPTIVLGP